MTTTIAKKSTAAKYNKGDGGSYHYVDAATVATNPSVNDIIKYLIPAGTEVVGVSVQTPPMDTNGSPTLAFKVGYEAVDSTSGLAAVTNYFAAAGQTTARAGGRLSCAFVPLIFNEDVYLTLTWTAVGATFVAGDVTTIVTANTIGIK